MDEASCNADGPFFGDGCLWVHHDVVTHLGDSCERTPGASCVHADYYGDGCGGGPPEACPDLSLDDYLGEYFKIVGDEVWLVPRCGQLFGSSPRGWEDCFAGPIECTCACLEHPSSGTGTGTGTTG